MSADNVTDPVSAAAEHDMRRYDMTGSLTPSQVEHLERETRVRCLRLLILTDRVEGGTINEKQIADIQDLAVDLYDTAARHGMLPRTADAVTSLISAAIDAIRARDRQRGRIVDP